jgi:hypothetical protein
MQRLKHTDLAADIAWALFLDPTADVARNTVLAPEASVNIGYVLPNPNPRRRATQIKIKKLPPLVAGSSPLFPPPPPSFK